MPQLNPAPWFGILVFSWLVLLIILPPKVMAHTSPNGPTTKSSKSLPTTLWGWPWL